MMHGSRDVAALLWAGTAALAALGRCLMMTRVLRP